MDDNGGSEASELRLEELKDEYSSRPPEIAEWLWCIEYVAKFVKYDIRCIIDLMKMGYQYSDDYGRRINEVLSLRILELIFDPSKNDGASTSKPRVEFDLSMSNANVLREILREIPLVSELRAGMPELSKFNLLPFIAHKNMCLPQCALEKLRDVSLMENETSEAPSMEANGPVLRDDRLVLMDTCEEEPLDEQQAHIGMEQNINGKDKVTVIDDEDEPMQTNEKKEEILIDEYTENDKDAAGEPISNGKTAGETSRPSSRRWPEDARVKCTKDGTWLISVSDEDTENGKVLASEPISNGNTTGETSPPSSRRWPEDARVQCTEDGTWLISVSDEDTENGKVLAGEPISNGNTTGETSPPSSRRWPEDARVQCTEDGTWLISESDDDDDDDMVKGPASRTRPENVCWKCGKEGTLLICSRSECSSKVHKECLKCPFSVDEDGNLHCPVCWYNRVVTEYIDSQKLMSSAKRRLVELFPVLSTRSKRLRLKRSETPLCLTAW